MDFAEKKAPVDEVIIGLDEEPLAPPTLTLISSNKKEFKIELKSALLSKFVATVIEQDPTAKVLTVPRVDSAMLAFIVSYLDHHKGVEAKTITKPLLSIVMHEVCDDKWDAKFIDDIDGDGKTRQQIYDLILAANYMDVRPLLTLCSAKVASLVKGKPLSEIPVILNKGTRNEVKSEPPKEEKVEAKDKDMEDMEEDVAASPSKSKGKGKAKAKGKRAKKEVPVDSE